MSAFDGFTNTLDGVRDLVYEARMLAVTIVLLFFAVIILWLLLERNPENLVIYTERALVQLGNHNVLAATGRRVVWVWYRLRAYLRRPHVKLDQLQGEKLMDLQRYIVNRVFPHPRQAQLQAGGPPQHINLPQDLPLQLVAGGLEVPQPGIPGNLQFGSKDLVITMRRLHVHLYYV